MGPMNITIRPATESDSAIIAEFNILMAKETEDKSLPSDRVHHGVEALLTDSSKGIYLLAEANAEVIGQLMITYEWSDWRNGNFWWIQSVYVREESRGKGVFQALFGHVRRLAQERKDVCGLRLYVEKHNKQARNTYEKLGMKQTDYLLYEIDFVMGVSV
ncbi:MAG: GNAT family N-acetyltransferase [Ignavibacteriales bacterium]|nr:GNAT family N-acetyltransferase [Ignavibacteriales bacterium]